MNLLTLDFGNTNAKAALFRHGEMKESGLLADVPSWLKKHSLTFGEVQAVLAQVKPYDKELETLEHQGLLIDRIKTYWRGEKFAGLKVNYAQTLGEDRLVAAYWAKKNLTGATLLIGAGTYFTIDVVSDGLEGGYIMPGLKLLGEDLAQGAQLQGPTFETIAKDLLTGQDLPHDTLTALNGPVIAYAALIQKLLIRWSPAQVVVSGGQCVVVEGWLKTLTPSLPLHVRPDLVHYALSDWYQRNIVG
mgnify:CR=1 FL=1